MKSADSDHVHGFKGVELCLSVSVCSRDEGLLPASSCTLRNPCDTKASAGCRRAARRHVLLHIEVQRSTGRSSCGVLSSFRAVLISISFAVELSGLHVKPQHCPALPKGPSTDMLSKNE
ncbi:hypothetical protein MATL_G00172230 [Megalops atlanticus]|uniref:Uncharacterized protein n=1 Tax=Megalops atlanticus TaxID=7932 RepID=A0A9D3T0T0_MEGAT|nr:hypothetical protein MATL_G00172230 [Megalops atlanticus]